MIKQWVNKYSSQPTIILIPYERWTLNTEQTLIKKSNDKIIIINRYRCELAFCLCVFSSLSGSAIAVGHACAFCCVFFYKKQKKNAVSHLLSCTTIWCSCFLPQIANSRSSVVTDWVPLAAMQDVNTFLSYFFLARLLYRFCSHRFKYIDAVRILCLAQKFWLPLWGLRRFFLLFMIILFMINSVSDSIVAAFLWIKKVLTIDSQLHDT